MQLFKIVFFFFLVLGMVVFLYNNNNNNNNNNIIIIIIIIIMIISNRPVNLRYHHGTVGMIADGPCCPSNKWIFINCYSRSSKHENALIRILRIGGKICEICQHLRESIRHRIKPYVLCPIVYLWLCQL